MIAWRRSRDGRGLGQTASVLGVSDTRGGGAMTVVAVARASVMIAAYAMIACRLSSVITSKALPASTMPSHATALSGAVSTAMSAATAMTTAAAAAATATTTTTTTTLGIGGTDRGDIGRQECRHPECQCTSKDSNQRFFHFLFGSGGASGWLKCGLDLTQTPKFSHSDRLPGKRRSRSPERVMSNISTAPGPFFGR